MLTHINRADSASEKITGPMLRHRCDVCNANGKIDAVAHMEEREVWALAVLGHPWTYHPTGCRLEAWKF